MNWDDVLAEMREAHAGEIAPAHYAAVRARVMAEIRSRRRWGWAWVAATGVPVLAAVLAIVVGQRMRVEELPQRPIMAAVPPAPAQSAVTKTRRAKREEIVMKIESANPDVVIYWIAEAKGEY